MGYSMRAVLQRLVGQFSVRSSAQAVPSSRTFVPPGDYYSPIPSLEDVRSRHERIFDRAVRSLPGIDLNEAAQLQLLGAFGRYYGDLPFTRQQTPENRYYFDNAFYSYGDAITLYSMIRHVEPRRIVEVGSGFSSAVMLDTNARFFSDGIRCTFIEPYADRLRSLLRESDAVDLLEQKVQDVPLSMFEQLQANDILFIDSTHVSKTGSDVNHLIFEVLPRLQRGVYVHFHDVFYPFEYPEDWVYEGRAWNEDYLLRAFLQYNAAFQIMFFSSYIFQFHADAARAQMPLFMNNPGGGLWVRRA